MRARPVRRLRRDYSGKRFETKTTRREGGGRRRRVLWTALVLSALAGWTWFLGFSGSFRVDEIDVRGNERVQDWEIRETARELMAERRWGLVPKSGILFLPEDELRERLQERFAFAEVGVLKDPPRRLEIAVKERISTIFLQMPDGSQAVLDLEGVVIRTLLPSEAIDIARYHGPKPPGQDEQDPIEGLSILFSDRNAALAVRERAVDPRVVAAVIEAENAVLERLGGLSVSSIRVDGLNTKTLRVVTSEGWSVYLDAEQPLEDQLDRAAAVLRASVGADRARLDYIDARFGEKMFFKLR